MALPGSDATPMAQRSFFSPGCRFNYSWFVVRLASRFLRPLRPRLAKMRGKSMVTDFVTYLSFDGRCEEAFKHYEKVFKGKILMMMRHSDAPPGSGVPQNPETASRIMHARLEVGGRLLMGGDAPPHNSSKPQGFCVSVAVDDPAEAERIFGQLSEGGAIVMPIAETFWALRFGMVTDQFGTPWMVNCEKPIG
jgi:PhnB protein